jgi:hypothetical protein
MRTPGHARSAEAGRGPGIALARAPWVIVACFVAVTLPLVLLLVAMPSVANWYVVATISEELERDLGFRAATAQHPAWPGREMFQIVRVVPGGAFDRAGLRAGDVPRIHHGSADFYTLLQNHRGGVAEIRVLRVSASGAPPVEHTIRVAIPPDGSRRQPALLFGAT